MNKILRVFAAGLMFCGLMVTIPSKAVNAAGGGGLAPGGAATGSGGGTGGPISFAGYYVTFYEEQNDYISQGSNNMELYGKSVSQMQYQWAKYFTQKDWTAYKSDVSHTSGYAESVYKNFGFIVADSLNATTYSKNKKFMRINGQNVPIPAVETYYVNPHNPGSTPLIDAGTLDSTMCQTTNPQEAYQYTGAYHNSDFDGQLRRAIMSNGQLATKLGGYIAKADPGLAWRQYLQLLYSVYVNSGYQPEMSDIIEDYLRNTNRNGSNTFQVITVTAIVGIKENGGVVWYSAPEFYKSMLGTKEYPVAATGRFRDGSNWANTTTSASTQHIIDDATGWSQELRAGVHGRINFNTNYTLGQTYWMPIQFRADGTINTNQGVDQTRWRYTVFPTGYYGKDGGNSGYTFIASKVEEGPLAASYGLYLQTTPKNKPFDINVSVGRTVQSLCFSVILSICVSVGGCCNTKGFLRGRILCVVT